MFNLSVFDFLLVIIYIGLHRELREIRRSLERGNRLREAIATKLGVDLLNVDQSTQA